MEKPILKFMWILSGPKQAKQYQKRTKLGDSHFIILKLTTKATLESPLDCKEIQPVHSEDQPWDFFGRNDAKAETPVLWPPHAKSWLTGKDSDAGREGLGAGGEGDDRGWDGWMASLTWWMWVWVNSRSWWWTGRPGMLRFMGLQRVRHDWATELNWTMTASILWLLYHSFTQITVIIYYITWFDNNQALQDQN